jgi:hypothetical protein
MLNFIVNFPQKQSYDSTYGHSASLPWCQTPIWGPRPDCYYSQTVAGCRCGVPSLTIGCVRRLQLLLVLASAVILGSESCGTQDHILLSTDSRLPQLGGLGPRIYNPPPNRVAQLYPQAPGSLFVASYDSLGYCADIRTRLRAGMNSPTPQRLNIREILT